MTSATAEIVNLPAVQGQGLQTMPVVNLVERDTLAQRIERIAIAAKEAAKVIDTPEEYAVAADNLKDIATARAEAKALHKEAKDFFYTRHRDVCASEKELMDILDSVDKPLGRVMGLYQAKLEEQRKIEEAMIARQAKETMDAAAMELAEGLAECGDTNAAEGVLEQAAKMQPEFICESVRPRAKGTAVKQEWKWRVVDEKLIPDEFWILDERKINGVVRAMKDSTNITGIQAFPETNVHGRAR